MKRTLSLVLALVMVLGTFTSVFAAPVNTEMEDAGALLEDLGVLTGSLAGDLMLENNLKRQDAVVMISRLLGEEDEAKAFPEAEEVLTYEDLEGADPFYFPYLAWAASEGHFQGHSSVRFGYNEEMTVQQYLNVLLRVLGYDDVEYDDVMDKAVELELVEEALVNNAFITRGLMALSTKAALNTKMKDSDNTLAEELEIVMPVEEGELAIESFEAKNVNTLVATFNQEVDTEDITLAMKKGTTTVAGEFKWNEEKTVATFTSTAKLTNGTYAVEVTSEADKDFKLTDTIEIKSQYAAEIKILNDIALTGAKSKEAYVYYDVLDQYGESVRNIANITWSSSVAGTPTVNRTTGQITLKKDNEFVFGEKIFISGVDTRTGLSVQHELSVGQPRALDKISIEGFVKKGTDVIVTELPEGFKGKTYYMVFTAVDQNGNVYTEKINDEDVTFVSENPLLIKGFGSELKDLTVKGLEYTGVFIEPGMNVDRGGEANIMIISTKTGKRTDFNVNIGKTTILSQFDLLSPEGVTAEDEVITIPFQAFDQDGELIKNFNTLARNSSLNALSFNAGGQGNLKLQEQKDGTAKLEFTQTGQSGWAEAKATNGLDRPVSLTSIVTGGNASTLMLSISDKARPEAIKAVHMDNVVVEKGKVNVKITGDANDSFTFVDQYGRQMSASAAKAFFDVTVYEGNEFKGYTFDVLATYKGDTGAFEEEVSTSLSAKTGFTLTAKEAKTGISLDFEIVKTKGDETISVSPIKREPLTVIKIGDVKGFKIKDINKIYVETINSNQPTGRSVGTGDLASMGALVSGSTILEAYQPQVVLTGTYGSEDVVIPTIYYDVVEDNFIVETVGIKNNVITGIAATTSSGFAYSDFYDITTAQYLRKDAKATVEVKVIEDRATTTTAFDTVKLNVLLSDAAPVATSIFGPEELTVSPEQTEITNNNINTVASIVFHPSAYMVRDQYGKGNPTPITYKVEDIVESADGYAEGNFKVSGNNTTNLKITGAERGDTFTLILTAGNAKLTVKITVGADKNANIIDSINNYLNTLIGKEAGTGLEKQRIDSLR